MTSLRPQHVELLTVDGSRHGPYVGRTPQLCGPYEPALFTRNVAEQIVRDLHRDNCGLTARFTDGITLTFTWNKDYRDDDGTEVVVPDDQGLYAIGGLWPWDLWSADSETSPEISAYADGAWEFNTWRCTPTPHWKAYQRGFREARRVAPRA